MSSAFCVWSRVSRSQPRGCGWLWGATHVPPRSGAQGRPSMNLCEAAGPASWTPTLALSFRLLPLHSLCVCLIRAPHSPCHTPAAT